MRRARPGARESCHGALRPGPSAERGDGAATRCYTSERCRSSSSRSSSRSTDLADRHRDHGAPDLLAVQPDPRDPRRQPRHRRQRPVRRLRRGPRLRPPAADPDPPDRRRRRPVRARRRLPAGAPPGARADRPGRARSTGSSRRPSSGPSSTSPTRSPGRPPLLSADGHGALIVLERETGLEEVAETGVMIHADICVDLLRTIFAPADRRSMTAP